MINLNEFRLSFIWVKGFSNLVKDGAPMDFFNYIEDYVSEFQKAKTAETESSQWKLPWIHWQGKNFWRKYLGFQNLNEVEALKALEFIVPMYAPSASLVKKIQSSGCRMKAEGFFYPYSVALVINVTVEGSLSIKEMLEQAKKIREDRKYVVNWSDGSEDTLELQPFASKALDKLWKIAYGKQEEAMPAVDDPFTIATVISGTGDLGENVFPGSELHRMLVGLCTFQRLSEGDGVHPLDDTTRLKLKASQMFSNSNIIYGLRHSRAIWFPCYIKSVEKKIRKLGCYHRNLTFATLQTESLVSTIRTLINNQNNNSPALRQKGINAAQILGLMYEGKDETYKSWSIRKQIDDNDYMNIINQAREILNIL
ncbi:MAG: hypothetical protein NT166_26345 [Candidatus Aminicenantes bacterium]|nr:hypothetical protein [Candidatus Aminicenantes bacterium]